MRSAFGVRENSLFFYGTPFKRINNTFSFGFEHTGIESVDSRVIMLLRFGLELIESEVVSAGAVSGG